MITVTNMLTDKSAPAVWLFVCLLYADTKPPEAITMTTIVTVTSTVEDTSSLINLPTQGTYRVQVQYMCCNKVLSRN